MISFHGEEGVDAGALRNEFFVCALKAMCDDYFEGHGNRKLPKSYWGCEEQQQFAGV